MSMWPGSTSPISPAIRARTLHLHARDSGKREDLEKLRALGRKFDVILDDASHASYHQQLGFAASLRLP